MHNHVEPAPLAGQRISARHQWCPSARAVAIEPVHTCTGQVCLDDSTWNLLTRKTGAALTAQRKRRSSGAVENCLGAGARAQAPRVREPGPQRPR